MAITKSRTNKQNSLDRMAFLGGFITSMVILVFAIGQSVQASVYNDAVLADNPLLYWTFDEASGNAFSQVNNTAFNELTPMGTATRAASTTTNGGASLGSAASFNGTVGNRFAAADLFGGGVGFIAPPSQWAVEFWFNTAGAPVGQYISEGGTGTSNDDPAIVWGFDPNGTNELEAFKAGSRFSTVGVSQDEWHHAVLAFYGNGSAAAPNDLREIYIDGNLVTSDAGAFSAGHGLERFAIGSLYGGGNPFNGLIDEYAIYALDGLTEPASQAQVAAIADHYNVAAVPEPSSMALFAIFGAVAFGYFWRKRATRSAK